MWKGSASVGVVADTRAVLCCAAVVFAAGVASSSSVWPLAWLQLLLLQAPQAA
jgi:hypothetical protein